MSTGRYYTAKTIKILFGLSGNRCAFPHCSQSLIAGSSQDEDVAVLGEMCHIIAASAGGPRGQKASTKSDNSVGNLILLCPTHHSLVDAQPERYPAETLRSWKAEIEQRGRTSSGAAMSSSAPSFRNPKVLAPLASQLESLSRRTLLRSEQLDDGGDVAQRSGIRLSDSLYVERELQADLNEKLSSPTLSDRPVLLIGEPGVGKTSLLWSAISRARASERKAWLLDAPSLVSLFDATRSPRFELEMFVRYCESEEFNGLRPLLAIDTADLCLNDKARIDRFTEILSYLQHANVQILLASRPQESADLHFLNPDLLVLGDYSDREFEQAVLRYSRAYLRNSDPSRYEKVVEDLRDAAAQGFAIREVALKPLTLRMLFSIYAPDDINHAEVNIVGLYEEFWRRRVQDDIRAGSISGTEARDLSQAARMLGVTMFGDGTPDISADRARTALQMGGVPIVDLDHLAKRGVIQLTGTGRDCVVSFFHQTFFEHAAAEAIVGSPNSAFLQATFDQFVESDGNHFVGCVLERALVLAEARGQSMREISHHIALTLARGDEPYLSAGVYAYAHRRTNSPAIEDELRQKVCKGHQPTIERLLAVYPNMCRERRSQAVTLLGDALRMGAHRTNEKVFHFFERTVAQNPREVLHEIDKSGLVDEFIRDTLGTVQARMTFYTLAPHLAKIDPDWTFRNVTALANAALGRLAGEQDFEKACGVVEALAKTNPEQARQFISSVLSRAGDDAVVNAGQEETVAFSKLIDCVQPLPSNDYIAKAGVAIKTLPSQFVGRSYLAAAALACRRSGLGTTRELIFKCAQFEDKHLWHLFGTTTLSLLLECHEDLGSDERADLISEVCEAIVACPPSARDLMRNGLLLNNRVPASILPDLIQNLELENGEHWGSQGVLFHRIVEAAECNVIQAQESLDRLMATPLSERTAQKLLIQVRQGAGTAMPLRRHALAFALATKSPADAVIALLEEADLMDAAWVGQIEAVEQLAHKCLNLGDPVSRTRAAKLAQNLARLTARAPLPWEELKRRGASDRNEAARTAFCAAARHLLLAEPALWETRAEIILKEPQPNGERARAELLGAVSAVMRQRPKFCVDHFPEFFAAVFQKTPGAVSLMSLAAPMYVLNDENWPELPSFAEDLIVRTIDLSSKTCHRMYRVFAKLYLGLGLRAGSDWCNAIVRLVPNLHPEVARVVLPLAMNLSDDDFRKVVDFYAHSDGMPGGTLAKIAEIRASRERQAGMRMPDQFVSGLIASYQVH